jgi:hypothetical protein
MEDPTDLSWLLTGNDARNEPIPRATADDELYVIKSNPTHIPSKQRGKFGVNLTEYHIGYSTDWGAVALCGIGNDKIPTGCRCAPWHPEPDRTDTDCWDCFEIANNLQFEGKYPDELG